jgi:hypothetical protein
MRLMTVALLLAVSTPALADGLVVSKKVTTFETKDKALTKIKLLTLVPDVLACFSEPVEVDVDLDSDGKKIAVTTDRGDAARAKCLEGAFAKMKVKAAFKARVHLVAKPDPRKKTAAKMQAQNSAIMNEAVLAKLDTSGVVLSGQGSSGGSGLSGDFKASGGTGTSSSPQRVTIGDANGDLNGYTADEISRVIKARAGVLRACYQKVLEKQPTLSGKWTYELKIDEHGSIARAKLKTSTAKSTSLDACLTVQLKKMKFPAKGTIAVVTYPFIFQSQ